MKSKSALILLIAACSLVPGIVLAQQLSSVRNFSFPGQVYSIAVDGDNIFCGGSMSFARQWKLNDPTYLFVYATNGAIVHMAADKRFLYIAQPQDEISKFSIGNFTAYPPLPVADTITSLVVSEDLLFSAHSDGTVNQWQISTWKFLQTVTTRGCVFDDYSYCNSWLLQVNGDNLFTPGENKTIQHWRITKMISVRYYKNPIGADFDAIATTDDYVFAADDNHIFTWRISTGEALPIIYTFIDGWIYALAAGGDYVFCAPRGSTIRQYRISTQSLVRVLSEHTDAVTSLVLSGSNLFSGSWDRSVKQWIIPELDPNYTAPTLSDISSSTVTSDSMTATSFTTTTRLSSSQTKTSTNTARKSTTQPLKSETPTIGGFNPVDSTNKPPISIDFYIIVGSAAFGSLVVFLLSGCAYHFIKVSRMKRALNQKRLESANPLNSPNELAIFSSSRAESDRLEYIAKDETKSAMEASGADTVRIGVTSTLFTSKRQGLYVPGHYLLVSSNAIYQPINLIYSNGNCSVEVAQVLSVEIKKRCRSELIAVKTIKRLHAQLIDVFYQELSIMYFFVGKRNFVQLVGFCQTPYQILTDYYALGSLDKALLARQSVLPSKCIAVSFAIQISRALRQMHENGFSHSDIKALNIFVDKDENGELQCFLGDFGLAQVLDDTHLVVKAFNVLNAKGLTVPYAAPEMLQRFRVKVLNSTWSAINFLKGDVYSLGILLYEILNCDYAWQWNSRKQ